MPFAAVELKPGVDVQRTFSLNQAGVSQAQLLRYKEGLIETYGGWSQYTSITMASTVRDLHAWQDAAGTKHLATAGTAHLSVITTGSEDTITPQQSTTNFAPDFTSSLGSPTITIVDANSSGLPSTFNTVFFNTPVAVAGFLLHGAYKIATVLSSISYTITASANSTANVVSSGILPIFTTTANSASVLVTLPNHTFSTTVGQLYSFRAPTTVDGITVSGAYQVQTIVDSTQARINSVVQATATSTATMNSSLAQLVYYVTLGPQLAGGGYGAGTYASGGYGTGVSLSGAPGTPITTTDWTMDNWGQILVTCPKDGAIYVWSPDSGISTASVINTGPFFNGGIFVSMPQQILVAWRSCQSAGASLQTGLSAGTQNNLLVRWSDSEDYTNWTVSNQTAAGSFVIPTGSIIVGGIQGPSQGLIWTDVELWAMQYIGGTLIFNFTRIGSGCGAVGPHCMGTLNGVVYWMGPENFFMLGPNGVQVLPCSVWDFVFQNIMSGQITKVRCAPNSAFNEIKWFFPSDASTGDENDAYVKYNIVEGEWDYGYLPRSAWQDVSVLGNPIGAGLDGLLYQHETSESQTGVSASSFRSGWWTITEGQDFAFVDYVIPDFKYGTYSGATDATITITFYAVDYPGDTPRQYGPYTVTSATQYLTPRIRGRLMSVMVQGDGVNYWRLGRIRYRWAVAGRR